MSVRIATFKKLLPTEVYACTAPEAQNWGEGLADLRIEFGKQRTFQLDSRALNRPKIGGVVVASLMIDRQLKPAINFYPVPVSKFPEAAGRAFRNEISGEMRSWLDEQLAQGENRILGTEILLVEWQGKHFKTHCLRYL
jgi:hypothetical protein